MVMGVGIEMRLNGIGTGSSYHASDMHHVTECMHEHSHYKQEGATGIKAGAANAASQAQQVTGDQEGQLSLSAWMEKMIGKGKGLLKGIWGSNEISALGEPGDKSGEAQALAQIREDTVTDGISANTAGANSHQPDMSQAMTAQAPGTPQIAAAATTVQTPQAIESNPYFTPAEDIGGGQSAIWQKIKVKFKDLAGQLAGHLPGKFSGSLQAKNSFHARQEPPKQNLRKQSKFRRDNVEIDCFLTDDSYLLDSYDRKGEYSKLSTKK